MIVSEDSVKKEGVYIYTKRQPPNELILLQRLLARLPEEHPQQKAISEKLYQVKAGYSGEVDVDRILPEIGLPQDVIVIKGHNIRNPPQFLCPTRHPNSNSKTNHSIGN